MTAIATTLRRVFSFGVTRLPDPDPSLSPAEAVRLYQPNFPMLANCTISDPVVQGDELVFVLAKPPVQTKGSEPTLKAMLADLGDWACKPAATLDMPARWQRIQRFAESVHRERPSALDPFLIPLA